MKLNEQIFRIKSMMNITENNNRIISSIQKVVDGYLEDIRIQSEEWGLGEMDDLDEIESIENIRVVDYVKDRPKSKIFVIIDVNSKRTDFDNTILGLEYEINKLIPNAEIVVKDINDIRTFGPGIDW